MSSAVQICNMALSRFGNQQTIASLDEASNEARACSLFYDQCRQRLLRMYAWPFATLYASLALVAESPTTDWGYSYRYPSNALMVRRIVTCIGRQNPVPPPFEVGRDKSGRLIYANLSPVTVEYTADITDPGQFDPLFASALAWLIASEIAMPLAVKDALRVRALEMFQEEMSEASAMAANESQEGPRPDSQIITSRGGYDYRYDQWEGRN